MLVKLKDICTIKSSKRIFEKEYVESGIPFIRGKEITDKSISNPDNKFECYISKERFLELKESVGVPQVGDILITAVGTVGNTYYINKQIDFYYKDGNVIQFTNFSKEINSKYLYFFFNSSLFYIILNNILIGAVQKALTMDMLKEIKIDLPSKEVQDKIVNILSNIDNQIERNNAMTKRLQVLGNTIYSKEINKDTRYFNLKTVANISTGKEDANFASPNGKYNFYTCSEEISKCDEFAFDGNSILIAGNGNFNVKYYNGKFNAYQRTYVIQNNTLFGNIYYSSLRSIDSFSKNANGSIIKFITLGLVQDIQIPIFTDKVNHILNDIVSKLNEIILETEKLNELKNTLLPLLINGQLEV